VDRLLVDVFLQAHQEAPKEIILDLDATDDPLHGKQEGYLSRFLLLEITLWPKSQSKIVAPDVSEIVARQPDGSDRAETAASISEIATFWL
jgi:hypothetical protein